MKGAHGGIVSESGLPWYLMRVPQFARHAYARSVCVFAVLVPTFNTLAKQVYSPLHCQPWTPLDKVEIFH